LLSNAVEIESVAGFDTPFERGPGDLLLAVDVLGRQVIDMRLARLVRACDIDLARQDGRWLVVGVDVEWGGRWHHLMGRLNRHRAHRTWDAVELLTNDRESSMLGCLGPGLARLKVPRIADLLEQASGGGKIADPR